MNITVLADDLSGAAETAAAFLHRQVPVTLRLTSGPAAAGVTVIDLDTRVMAATAAQYAHRAALTDIEPGTVVFKKIDSMLRGNIGAEVAVLAERGPVVVAAALPALGRAVIDGVLHLDGVPLHRTGAWAIESHAPPHSVAEMFGSGVTVCDAATDADLDDIVATTAPGTQLVGTSALAAALARTLPAGGRIDVYRRACTAMVAVVGTADPKAREQVRRLVDHGFRSMPIPTEALLGGTAERISLADGPVVVTTVGDVQPAQSRELAFALGRLIASGLGFGRPDLILTGGETARAVIDAIGLTDLRPIHEVHHGAVVSVASDGRSVATRPGSFGDGDSLVAIADYLTSSHHVRPQMKDNS